VTVTLFLVQVTLAPIFSRTSANFTSPLISNQKET
jgi:flagellar assembly factor FliW